MKGSTIVGTAVLIMMKSVVTEACTAMKRLKCPDINLTNAAHF